MVMGLVITGFTSTFLNVDSLGEIELGNLIGEMEGKVNLLSLKLADLVMGAHNKTMEKDTSRIFIRVVDYLEYLKE